MLILQNNAAGRWELPGVTVSERPFGTCQARLDLIVDAVESDEGIELSWEFATALFDRATVERMTANYAQLLDAALAAPDQPLECLRLVAPAEAARLIAWSRPEIAAATGDRQGCVHRLIEAQAAAAPQVSR
jgi:non-ribosomal peptide synthetase component F